MQADPGSPRRCTFLLLLLVLCLAPAAVPAQNLIFVDGTTCTLPKAISLANFANFVDAASIGSATTDTSGCATLPPPGPPSFLPPPGSYTLLVTTPQITLTTIDNYWYGPNALPPIACNIAIVPTTGALTLTASHVGDPTPATANAFRFFYVSGGMEIQAGSLTLVHVVLEGGYAKGGDTYYGGGGAGMGGAVFNQGNLALANVTLLNNVAQGGRTGDLATISTLAGGGMGQDGQPDQTGGGFGGSFQFASYGGNGGSTDNSYGAGGGGGGGFLLGTNGSDGSSNNAGAGGGAGGLGGAGGPDAGAAGDGGGGGGGTQSFLGADGGHFGNGGGGIVDLAGGGGGGGVGGGGGGESGGGGFGGGGGGRSGGFGGGTGGFGGGGVEPQVGYGQFGGGRSVSGQGAGGAGMGGAIFNHAGSIGLLNVTATGNAARGGTSYCGECSGSGLGAVLFNLNGNVTMDFSTLAGNFVSGSNNGGSDFLGPGDGTVYSLAYGNKIQDGSESIASLTIHNSIIHGTQADGGGHDLNVINVAGVQGNSSSLTTLGINVIGKMNLGANTSWSGGVFVTDPVELGALSVTKAAPHPMPVLPLSSDSPAQYAAASCIEVDGSSPLTEDARGAAALPGCLLARGVSVRRRLHLCREQRRCPVIVCERTKRKKGT